MNARNDSAQSRSPGGMLKLRWLMAWRAQGAGRVERASSTPCCNDIAALCGLPALRSTTVDRAA